MTEKKQPVVKTPEPAATDETLKALITELVKGEVASSMSAAIADLKAQTPPQPTPDDFYRMAEAALEKKVEQRNLAPAMTEAEIKNLSDIQKMAARIGQYSKPMMGVLLDQLKQEGVLKITESEGRFKATMLDFTGKPARKPSIALELWGNAARRIALRVA